MRDSPDWIEAQTPENKVLRLPDELRRLLGWEEGSASLDRMRLSALLLFQTTPGDSAGGSRRSQGQWRGEMSVEEIVADLEANSARYIDWPLLAALIADWRKRGEVAEALLAALKPFVELADKRNAIYRKRGGNSDAFPDTHPAYDIKAEELRLGIWRQARAALKGNGDVIEAARRDHESRIALHNRILDEEKAEALKPFGALSAEEKNADNNDQHDADDADAAGRTIGVEGMVTAKPSE